MKKVFSTTAKNKNPERQVDAIKHELKKYIARERRRDLPEGADFWDFECKAGPTQETATDSHLKELTTKIDQLVKDGKQEFYIEIIAKPRKRLKKQG